MIICLCKL